ncbi:putative Ig domain-containing protein, partial [Oscillospiraceae bacterium OttesenSCG-928-G22]|nr:putative Ig domain-containing protein [Oscillospiraceae bacterium OttesenSCG-928-G22]
MCISKNRILSLALTLCMVLSLLPITAAADEETRSATVADVTISGIVDSALPKLSSGSLQSAIITLVNDTIKYDFYQSGVVDWFAEKPSGISVTAGGVSGGSNIVFEFSSAGTTPPTSASSALLEITIPGAVLTSGQDLAVTVNPNARFQITAAGDLAFADSVDYDIPASTVNTAIDTVNVSNGVSGGTPLYSFSATGLPDGISIDSATGVISGTPTTPAAAGTATITVTDKASGTQSISINYGEISAATPGTFAVTVTNGTANPASAAADTTVTLTANTPASGKQFKEWEITPSVTFVESTSKTDAVAKITMPGEAVSATATYENIPSTVSGIEIDTVAASGTGYTWDDTNKVVTITADGTYNITQNNSGAATPNRIVVNDNLTGVTLAINGLNIVAPDTANGAPAIALGAGSNVALQLSGSNALTGTRAYAGIQTSDATLTINGNGSLTVIGGSGWGNAAGIGGNSYEMGTVGNGGIIIVNNGTITTQRLGCGGNGGDDANGGNGGHVTINGGTIKGVNTQLRIASGGSSSNGYACGTGGTVIINGGFIDNINDATIGEGGASGNGGTGGNGGNVTINGGTVIAYAIARGGKGSGSGVCHGGNGGTVEITGGSVKANTAMVAAGGTGGGSGSSAGSPGTITNGSANVYLTTLTVGSTPVADTEIIGITAPTGYGINDVKTDTSGMLYFWLPTSVTEVSLNTADYIYSNSAVEVKDDHTGAATLAQGSTTPPAATGTMTIGGKTVALNSNQSGTGWTWTAGNATLKLTSDYGGAPIAIKCDSTDTINLVYTGNVSITSAAVSTLYCFGSLNITGSGGTLALSYTGSDSQCLALEAYGGALKIGGAAVVNATGAGSEDSYAAVIYGNAGVTISGSASVTATATGTDASGIWSADGDITISTSGTVTANGNGAGSALRHNGLLHKLSITNGTLNLTGNPMNFDTDIAPVITGGTVNISGTQVYLATLTLSGVNTETTITAVTAPASGYGIQRMKSDANGKLYFWLPAGSQTVTLTAGGNIYTGTFTVAANHTNAATLTRPSEPAITSANSTTFTVGTAGNFTVAASNSPTAFACAGTLPSGVSFNTATGALSGTPAAGTNGTYNLSFTATNASGTSTAQSFTLTVTLAKASTPTTASFNGADMSLTGVTTGMSYSLNGGTTYINCTGTTVDLSAANVTTTNGIWVITRGDNINNIDSDPQKLIITKAAAPSGVGKTDETTDDADDGTLTGLTTAMEYKLSTVTGWTSGTGSDITGLAPGTYHVRTKGGTNTLPSDHIAIAIGAFGDTAVTFSSIAANGAEGTTTTTELTLTFDQEVVGLTDANITLIDGTGSATKGTLTHVSGGTYKLGVTVSAAGSITVEVSSPAGFAINPASQSVAVHQMAVTNHTVTFNLNGGTHLGGGGLTQTVPNGNAAIAPIVTRNGYTFNGWDKSFTNVTQDLTVTAQWKAINNNTGNTGGGSTTTPSNKITAPTTEAGWTDAAKKVNDLKDGSEFTVDMKNSTTVSGDFLEAVAGKDVDLTFDIGGGMSWTVNGKDIPKGVDLAALNLGVSTGTTFVPAEVRNIDGSIGEVQLRLSHNGELPFPMTLSVKLDKVNAGNYANLYYYNPETGELEFQSAVKIGADGTTEFVFDHASDYLIVVAETSLAPEPETPWQNPFTDVKASDWFYGDV